MELNKHFNEEMALKCINYWGVPAQLLKTLEELNELSQAVLHFLQGCIKEFDAELKLAEEIADVEIMMEQLKVIMRLQVKDEGRAEKEFDDLVNGWKENKTVTLDKMLKLEKKIGEA